MCCRLCLLGTLVVKHESQIWLLCETCNPLRPVVTLSRQFCLNTNILITLWTKFICGRARGAMDNASDYGSEDSRFESWRARTFAFFHFLFKTPSWPLIWPNDYSSKASIDHSGKLINFACENTWNSCVHWREQYFHNVSARFLFPRGGGTG